MPKDNNSPTGLRSSPTTTHRGRLYVALLALVVTSMAVVGAVISRDDESDSPPVTGGVVNNDATTTATTVSTRTEVTSRLREILETRDRALLARNARLLSGIYTTDCECLEDGQALIQKLRKENILWKGVRTEIEIRSTEEVNDRLWIVVATVRTPSVRIETEAGSLVRVVPPERNLVRFALAKPHNEQDWLLGHASTLE